MLNIFKSRRNKAELSNISAVNIYDGLIKRLDSEIKMLEKAVRVMKKKYKTDELPLLINNLIFFRISFSDILSTVKQIIPAEGKDKNLLLRSLSLHMYEFLDDTKDFLGPRLRKDLCIIPNSVFHLKQLQELKILYKSIRESAQNNLGGIRHNTIAHKEQNSIELNRLIKSIKTKEGDIQMAFILVSILFGCIIRFQKNIITSITKQGKIKEGDLVVIFSEVKKWLYILKHELPYEVADYLSKLSNDQLITLKVKLDEYAKWSKSEYK